MEIIMKVKTDKLLLIAAIVWFIAGFNVIKLGVAAYNNQPFDMYLMILALGTLAIFVVFHVKIFSGMVAKHSDRIGSYTEEKTAAYKFFDKKSFMIMAIMIGGGIALRAFELVPNWFIAFFYTGLGLALALAGISFGVRYFKGEKMDCPVNSKISS